MINQVYIDDKKVKDILTYIAGMRHAEQIRMMFLCSLNGMRSINFCYLQVKDVYNDDLSVKDVICLDENKNKGKFGANYYLNSQMKKEFKDNVITGENGVYLISELKMGDAGFLDFDIELPSEADIYIGYGEHLWDGLCRTNNFNYTCVIKGKKGRNFWSH